MSSKTVRIFNALSGVQQRWRDEPTDQNTRGDRKFQHDMGHGRFRTSVANGSLLQPILPVGPHGPTSKKDFWPAQLIAGLNSFAERATWGHNQACLAEFQVSPRCRIEGTAEPASTRGTRSKFTSFLFEVARLSVGSEAPRTSTPFQSWTIEPYYWNSTVRVNSATMCLVVVVKMAAEAASCRSRLNPNQIAIASEKAVSIRSPAA